MLIFPESLIQFLTLIYGRLVENDIHGKLLHVLQSMYSPHKSCIKRPQGLSEYFRSEIGIRQGCMISPSLMIRLGDYNNN